MSWNVWYISKGSLFYPQQIDQPQNLPSLILKQYCGSGMFISGPGSWFLSIPDSGSRIQDPRSNNNNKRGGGKIGCLYFFTARNLPKWKLFNLMSCSGTKKIWANRQRILTLFTKKIVTKLSEIPGLRIRDLGSRKTGGKKAPHPGYATVYCLRS